MIGGRYRVCYFTLDEKVRRLREKAGSYANNHEMEADMAYIALTVRMKENSRKSKGSHMVFKRQPTVAGKGGGGSIAA